MRVSLSLMILSIFLFLAFSSSAGEKTKTETPNVSQWIIVNALLVDKNNVKIRLFYLDSPPANVKNNARRSCKDGVNIILPAYMLMKYEGDPLRIDFDLLNAKYHLFEKLKDKVAASGSMVIGI